MRTLASWLVALAVLGWACGVPSEEPSPGGDRIVVDEIPVTTDSESALADFEAGQRKLDVGRAAEANALFRRAVEEDPSFASAHLNIANSAASAVEFKTHLDLAAAHLEGKSPGERIRVEILATFLDNDAEQRVGKPQIERPLGLGDQFQQEVAAHQYLGGPHGAICEEEEDEQADRGEDGAADDVDPGDDGEVLAEVLEGHLRSPVARLGAFCCEW